MKKKFSLVLLAFALVFGLTLAPTTAKAATNGYVSKQYLIWDTRYTPDRSGIGHYIVTLNDPSTYLNVRSGPSTSYSVIGILHHGDAVTTDGRFFYDPNWAYILYPTF